MRTPNQHYCETCGADLFQYKRSRIYCERCRDERKQEQMRKSAQIYRETHRDAINQRMRKNRKKAKELAIHSTNPQSA